MIRNLSLTITGNTFSVVLPIDSETFDNLHLVMIETLNQSWGNYGLVHEEKKIRYALDEKGECYIRLLGPYGTTVSLLTETNAYGGPGIAVMGHLNPEGDDVLDGTKAPSFYSTHSDNVLDDVAPDLANPLSLIDHLLIAGIFRFVLAQAELAGAIKQAA